MLDFTRQHPSLLAATLSLAAFTMIGMSGCEPVTMDGKSGRLGFNYDDPNHDDDEDGIDLSRDVELPSVTPVAVGASTQINVFTRYQEQNGIFLVWRTVPAEVVSASSTDREVFEVVGIEPGGVIIEGRGEGIADLVVLTQAGQDSISVHVREQVGFRLAEPDVWFSAQAPGVRAHLESTTEHWEVEAIDDRGTVLRTDVRPDVVVIPDSAADVSWTDTGLLAVHYLEEGPMQIDFGLGLAAEQRVVAPEDVVAAEVALWSNLEDPIPVGDARLFNTYGLTDDGASVLGVMAETVFWTEDEDVCVPVTDESLPMAAIEARGVGVCVLHFVNETLNENDLSGELRIEVVAAEP